MSGGKYTKILVLGLIFLTLLAIPAVSASPLNEDSGSESIAQDQYWYYRVELPNGGGVEYDISADASINVYFMDEVNMLRYSSGQSFQYVDEGSVLNTQHAKTYFTISNSSGGNYYIVVETAGPWGANFTYEIRYGEDLEMSFFDFFGALGVLGCLIGVIVLFVWLYVLYWVYKDAKRRGKSGALWLIIVFFLGIIGLIIWLIVRPKEIKGEKAVVEAPPPP